MTHLDLRIAHINIRSLLPKILDLKEFVSLNKIHILTVSETWLNSNISDELVHIENYVFVRSDREGRGGGVGIYVHNSIRFTLIDMQNNNIEQIWILVQICQSNVALGSVYNPYEREYVNFLNEFENSVANCLPCSENILCLGDINIDFLNFENRATIYMQNILESLGLYQIITQPTRTTLTTTSLLDLIITSDSSLIKNSGVIDCHLSDHDLPFCDVFSKAVVHPVTHSYRNLNSIELNSFNFDLENIPFQQIVHMPDINDKINFLNSQVIALFNKHAPVKTRQFVKPSTPWITDNLKFLISLRNKAKAKFKQTKLMRHWEYYKTLRNLTTLSLKNEKKAYFNFIFNKNHNSKQMWKKLNALDIGKNKKNTIPTHLADANVINNYFVYGVGNVDQNNQAVPIDIYHADTYGDHHLDFTTVDTETVSRIIFNIKSNAMGTDNINIEMIKLCCPFIIPYITHLINSCILEGIFPECWKNAVIKPIPKNKKPSELKDLRPISLLPTLSKIFEKIINGQLTNYIDSHDLLPSVQSGFRTGYSCTTALLKVTDDILTASDEGKITALVLLDYSKAFDTVNHDILINILNFIGVTGNASSLICSYLSNRSQIVKLDAGVSDPLPLTQGVPQGSILGPLLFSIYTSIFMKNVKYCKTHIYADDTQLYHSFIASDLGRATEEINFDLQYIYDVSSQHSLKINPNKSAVILFGNKNVCRDLVNTLKLSINHTKIPVVNEVKSLGLMLDNTFRYRNQISKYICLGYQQLRKLYPHRSYLNKETKKNICESLVLSHFNFCVPIYHSALDKITADRIQKVQNACLRFIYGIRKFDHISHKLADASWLTMINRRILQCQCFFHHIINSKTPAYLYDKITFRTDVHNINTRFRGLISPPLHFSSCFERSFTFQIYYMYNSLPIYFKNLKFDQFKSMLKLELLQKQYYNHQ